MSYLKKYQTLKTVLQRQDDVALRAQLDPLIKQLDDDVINQQKTHKQAFFSLLQVLIAFDLEEIEIDENKRALEAQLKALDIEGNDLASQSESDSQDGESKKPNLISEDEDLFVFLCKNGAPFIPQKVFAGVLNGFLSKTEGDDEAMLRKTNWLLSIALYQQFQKTKRAAKRKQIQRILLGYLSGKTNDEEIEHVITKLKDFNTYCSLDDIIFYRMTDKARGAFSSTHGPYQDTFLDTLRHLVSGHQSHAQIKLIKKYDTHFKMHGYRFIEMVKALYKELSASEKSRLKLFVNKLEHFDKRVRKLIVMYGLEGHAGGGISVIARAGTKENERMVADINAAATALFQEAHELFDQCMPGTVSYHILAASSFVLGMGLLTLGILALALFPAAGLAVLGGAAFYGLCATSITVGFGFGLFAAPVLNKARNCVATSTRVANTAVNVIGHCKEAGVNAASRLDLSTPPPAEVEGNQEKIEDPTSRSPRLNLRF
jgi:hypothetical protein